MGNFSNKQKLSVKTKGEALKFLFIVPYITWHKDIRDHSGEPTGFLYLATYASKQIKKEELNIQIRFLDLQGEGENITIKTDRGYRSGLDDQSFIGKLVEYKPDVVGIANNYTNSVNDVLEICQTVKKNLPLCKVVVGGAHATIAHKEMINEPNIDIIVRGEGEITFWELLKNIYWRKNLIGVKGITFKNKNKIIINPNRLLIEDLNSLQIPDRSLIDFEKYFSRKRAFTKTIRRIGNIISSRGCPFNCIFCSTSVVWTHKWRSRSPENILEEIKYLVSTYGINEINFQDDQFMWDKDRVKKLCHLVIKNNLKIALRTPPGISPWLIDEETIELMSKAGFYEMTFSVDAGTEESKKYSRKPINLSNVRNLVKKANSLGMITTSTFVIGYPHEREEDIKKVIKYAHSLRTDYVNFYIAQPQIGSELYELLKKLKRIDDKVHDLRDTSFGTDHISAKRLMELTDEAMYGYAKRYYLNVLLNPKYFLREFYPKVSNSTKLYQYFKLVIMWYALHSIRRTIGDVRYFSIIKKIRRVLKNKRI